MAKIRPLTPDQAKRTLAAKFAGKFDKLRQLNTKFGVRPYRCFLVWSEWTGDARGEGDARPIETIEILPTPLVESLDSVTFSLFAAGSLPVGSMRVSQISAARYTADMLAGRMFPNAHEDQIPEKYEFFWEIHEDGRADPKPVRMKFRLMTQPFLRPGRLDWSVALERISQDRDREGNELVPTFSR